MYRIKYFLGAMVAIFSLVYLTFGVIGWVRATSTSSEIVICFTLASLHLASGIWLLLSSVSEERRERRRLELVTSHLIDVQGGRVRVSDVARYAEVHEDDAREFLEKRAQHEVSYLHRGRNGRDLFYFGQQFWNN